MTLFTDDQIALLAPDLASLKAGRDLAKAPKWPALAHSDRVLWGEVQGSGKDPYRTQVDLTDTAFNCSCPSRKFPCKHGIGLLTLFVREAGAFVVADEPAWVSNWIGKRTEKAAKAIETPPAVQATDDAVADRKARDQQKRADSRLGSIRAGVAELDLWLDDLIGAGLLTLPDRGAAFWQKTAARMVDAKAPGLATRVRQLGDLPFFDGNAWQADALRQLGQLHLLTSAFGRMAQLPPDLLADVQTQIGLTVSQKELLEASNTNTLTDQFWVLARQTTQEDDLTVQRNFLYGQQSGRFALVLNFAHQTMPIDTSLLPGTCLDATLVFFPGRWPYRAVVKNRQQTDNERTNPVLPPICANWEAAQETLTDVLAQSPWADAVPQLVGPLTLATANDRHFLRDERGHSLPLDPHWPDDARYRWLALTGGQPTPVFLIRYPTHIDPLGLWLGDTYTPL